MHWTIEFTAIYLVEQQTWLLYHTQRKTITITKAWSQFFHVTIEHSSRELPLSLLRLDKHQNYFKSLAHEPRVAITS